MSLILDLLASGVPVEEILADYRGLTKEDIHACIAFSGKRRRDWRRWRFGQKAVTAPRKKTGGRRT